MTCQFCCHYHRDKCRRYPTFVIKSGGDLCGEFKQAILQKVAVAPKEIFKCSCGKEFRSDHALKVHVGRLGKNHART